MKRKNENGFENWGGYMNAKISKLEDQFSEEKTNVSNQNGKISDIFKEIAIFVNGYTEPSSEDLRCLMLHHGGTYHHYFRSEKTTHIIASSLPNSKYNQMKTLKIVTPDWITDSIKAGKLLNYSNYLLINNLPQAADAKKNEFSSKFCTKKETNSSDLTASKTAADEGYLKEFYSSSRLHHISMLGNTLKQYIWELREKHTGSFPKRKLLFNHSDVNSITEEDCMNETIIMHIDLDCFFVAVALRNHPHLKGHPVAVTHAKSNSGSKKENISRDFEVKFYKNKMRSKIGPKTKMDDANSDSDNEAVKTWSTEVSSMSEIASCSYEARKFGVCKGMYLGAALKLCPNLKTVQYDFEGYKEVSMMFYNIIADYTLDIEAVSCDELYLDCTSLLSEIKISPSKLAEIFRSEIETKTHCTASIGIGPNKLQARLATKHAKPNGQFYLSSEKLNNFLSNLSVHDIPGVGRTIGAQLRNASINTCKDLQKLSLTFLKREFGDKTGETLFNYCRGIDDKKVNFNKERKSISAEVNYGIRFNDNEEAELFLKQLSQEVSSRLKNIKMMGKSITLKVMFRAKGAPVETAKYLGHGACDVVNRSVGLPSSTNDSIIISKQVTNLFHQLNIPPVDLRGIGIQINKLETEKKASKSLCTYFERSNVKENTINDSVGSETPRPNEPTPTKTFDSPHKSNNQMKNIPPEDGEFRRIEEIERLLKLHFKEFKKMIKEWVAAEQDPELYDIMVLKTYFKFLIEKKNLEVLCVLIRCLHGCIKNDKKKRISWQIAYDDIIDSVQSCMVTALGRTLVDEVI